MLNDIPFRGNEALIKIGYQICRWHHERYDGKGYPDGLKGEEIPIAAQVVSLADVYDALTSKRVYKDAYPPDTAVRMILNGECGAFNPLLLECLTEISDQLIKELDVISLGNATDKSIHESVRQMLGSGGADASNRTIRLLEQERMKFQYLTDISREILFEYIAVPEMIKFSEWGAQSFGLPVKILNPAENPLWNKIFPKDDFNALLEKMRSATPENSVVSGKYQLNINGRKKWYKVIAKVLVNEDEAPEIEGAIGKIVDINEETKAIEHLEQMADIDVKTGLLNFDAAKQKIKKLLSAGGGRQFALAMFDLDNFKEANDVYGHLFGDEVLKAVAQRIRANTRNTDIAARMGGDEFILFMEYKGKIEPLIRRIFNRLIEKYRDFNIGLSMGVACTDGADCDFDVLFEKADSAMYAVKRKDKCAFRFYDGSMPLLKDNK